MVIFFFNFFDNNLIVQNTIANIIKLIYYENKIKFVEQKFIKS